jgi:hypothetical protein
MWVHGKMVPKCKLLENIILHIQELNYGKGVYELEGHVGEEALNLDLLPKLGLSKKTLPTSFPSCLLKSVQVKPTFLYALLPCHEEVKRNTIGIIKGTNAKLPHHRGHVPTYPMENKMPLIHHTIKS